MKKWECSICGYIHEGDEPPLKCPVCGADRSKFVLLEETTADPQTNSDKEATPVKGTPADSSPPESKAVEVTATENLDKQTIIMNMLTQLHAHPIAVHIPNGVLPLTVVMTFLAVIFHSTALATAATYNMLFVCLSMPVVILTGLIDWKGRFEGRMSRVFLAKMICAGIVTLLSIILFLWWIVEPTVYTSWSGGLLFFILLNCADLAAAAVAGWYGGKLVFPKT